MKNFNATKADLQQRMNEDNKLYLMQCVLRIPELFSLAKDELKPEHFDPLSEPQYALLWRSALITSAANDNALPSNEELARTLVELEATKLVDMAPSNLSAGGLLDQLFDNLEGEPGLISSIYNSRNRDTLDFKAGMTLLKQFLKERVSLDPFKRLADQINAGLVVPDIDNVLDKLKAANERINSLDVSPIEEFVPNDWEANAIVQVPTNINFIDAATDGGPAKGEVMVLLGPTGGGKFQPMYSLIQTPTGPVTMGSVYVGQEICAVDGTTTKITGVFPQSFKSIYRITFNDDTYVDAGEEHLWKVDSIHNGWKGKVVTTKYLLDKHRSASGECQLSIAVPAPIKMNSTAVPVDPYLMGLLLGDGSFRHNQIGFTNMDKELLDAAKNLCGPSVRVVDKPSNNSPVTRQLYFRNVKGSVNLLKKAIWDLGLKDKYSYEKSIPDCYLYNDVQSRLSLLQGLMDTDGHVGSRSHVNFYTSSKKLAEQVQWLVESLGGLCKIRTKKISGYTRDYYDCVIHLEDASTIFRLKRKKDRVKPRTHYKIKRIIKSVSLLGMCEAQCISVDHPSKLYLTDHCVATHNTLLGIMLAVNGARYQMQRFREGEEAGYWYYFSYESPITPDIRCRMMSYAAELHFGETMKKFTSPAQLSTSVNLKDYEIKRWEKQIKAGLPVPGELERYNAAILSMGDRLKLVDMSGTKNPSVGTKGVEEIARVLQDEVSQGRQPVGIVIDYAGIMVERYMAARNEKIENEFHYLNRFVNNIRTQVAGRFNCISWVMHQLHGESAAASPTAKQHHSKARGARNFADNANFAFNIGTKDPQTNCCIVTCTKARRAEMIKNPPIVFIDGAFGRMEVQDQKYQLDKSTNKIIDKQVAKVYKNDLQNVSQMIARKPKGSNPGTVSDI